MGLTSSKEQSSPELKIYSEKNTELSQYIQELGDVEQELAEQLMNTRDVTEQRRLGRNLELIQNIRNNLTNALSNVNSFYSQNLTSASSTLKQQTDAVAIIDKEMEIAKRRLAYINQQKQNKLRLVEVNQYYSASYSEWTYLLKLITGFIIGIVLLVILQEKFPFIPPTIYRILTIMLIIVAIYYIGETLVSIYSRDKMVYEQYGWPFQSDKNPTLDLALPYATTTFKVPSLSCIGEMCCHTGTVWNDEIKQCDIPGVSTTTSKSSFAAV